jgi:PTH1 family peptidyl-tRNA hydrolase
MWLVVGLGNPGRDYEATRHNAGFLALERLAGAGVSFSNKFHGEFAQTELGGEKCLLLKPQTYMNNSGRAVQAAMAFYKLAPENVIVIYDELDLPPGKLRIKQGGGANGHNGIKDIDAAIGQNYWRIRIGIGHPLRQGANETCSGTKGEVHDYVLGRFSKEDREVTATLLASLATHFPLFWQHSPAGLMSKIVEELAPPKPSKKAVELPDGD